MRLNQQSLKQAGPNHIPGHQFQDQEQSLDLYLLDPNLDPAPQQKAEATHQWQDHPIVCQKL